MLYSLITWVNDLSRYNPGSLKGQKTHYCLCMSTRLAKLELNQCARNRVLVGTTSTQNCMIAISYGDEYGFLLSKICIENNHKLYVYFIQKKNSPLPIFASAFMWVIIQSVSLPGPNQSLKSSYVKTDFK